MPMTLIEAVQTPSRQARDLPRPASQIRPTGLVTGANVDPFMAEG